MNPSRQPNDPDDAARPADVPETDAEAEAPSGAGTAADPSEETTDDAPRRFDSIVRFMRWMVLLVVVFTGLLLFRSQVLDGYQVPTHSMEPTLHGHPRDGDKVLVFKKSFWLRDPERWDIAVFRREGARHASQVFVKRITGLPGETFELVDGDVYVDGHIARKPDDVERELLIPVWESRGNERGFADAWEAAGETGPGWNKIDGSFVIPPGDGGVFEYARPITDSFVDDDGVWKPGPNAVGDLVLVLAVTPTSEEGTVVVSVGRGSRAFDIALPVSEGRPTISSLGTDAVLDTVEPLQPGRRYRLRVTHVDHRLRVALDGRDLYTFAYEPTPALDEPDSGGSASFGIVGGGGRIHSVRLLRDIYYTADGEVAVDGPILIPNGPADRDQRYFVLGDNSAKSRDSRFWGGDVYQATVSREDLIGSPVAVFWPPSRARRLR